MSNNISVPIVFKELLGESYWEKIKGDRLVLKSWLKVVSIAIDELRWKFNRSLVDIIEKLHLEYELLENCELIEEALTKADPWQTPIDILDDRIYTSKKDLTEVDMLNLSGWCVSNLLALPTEV